MRVAELGTLVTRGESGAAVLSGCSEAALRLEGHTAPVFDVAWAPRGPHSCAASQASSTSSQLGEGEDLVSVSADATARLWRVKHGAAECSMLFKHGAVFQRSVTTRSLRCGDVYV